MWNSVAKSWCEPQRVLWSLCRSPRQQSLPGGSLEAALHKRRPMRDKKRTSPSGSAARSMLYFVLSAATRLKENSTTKTLRMLLARLRGSCLPGQGAGCEVPARRLFHRPPSCQHRKLSPAARGWTYRQAAAPTADSLSRNPFRRSHPASGGWPAQMGKPVMEQVAMRRKHQAPKIDDTEDQQKVAVQGSRTLASRCPKPTASSVTRTPWPSANRKPFQPWVAVFDEQLD